MHTLNLDNADTYEFIPREVTLGRSIIGHTVNVHTYKHLYVGARVNYGMTYRITAFFTHSDGELAVELLREEDNMPSWDYVKWATDQTVL